MDALTCIAVSATAVTHIEDCRAFVLVVKSDDDREILRRVFSSAGWRLCQPTDIPRRGRCVVFATDPQEIKSAISRCKDRNGRCLIVAPQEPEEDDVEYMYVDNVGQFPLSECILAAKGIVPNADPTPDEMNLFRQLFDSR